MTETLKTGILAVDRYLTNGYDEVRGFSSRFAATICGHLLRRQSELGIRGSVAEIGTFEGRFFIALGLAVGEGERAYGFDLFAWPGSEVLERLLANAEALGTPALHPYRWRSFTGSVDAGSPPCAGEPASAWS